MPLTCVVAKTLQTCELNMGSKRPPQGEKLDAATAGDLMELTPLGAGQEVGRSCLYLTFKGKTIMVRFRPRSLSLPPCTTLFVSLAGNGHALVATCPPCSVNGEQDCGLMRMRESVLNDAAARPNGYSVYVRVCSVGTGPKRFGLRYPLHLCTADPTPIVPPRGVPADQSRSAVSGDPRGLRPPPAMLRTVGAMVSVS
jgi:hypothetical protein